MGNELGRLAQGVGTRMPHGTDTIFFIPKSQLPTGRKVTYANAICDHRPLKTEPYRVRLTVGGDKLEYAGDAGSPAASIIETKLLVNSVISTPGENSSLRTSKIFFSTTPRTTLNT